MQASATLQELLNQFGHVLKVDGIVGPKTRMAIDDLLSFERVSLDAQFEEKTGMKVRAVVGERGFTVPDYNYLRASHCHKIIDRGCELLGMGSYSEVFKDFLDLEAIVVSIGGERCYDVLSKNGQHRGLNQFSVAAWTDARSTALGINRKIDIGSYKENVYMPANNIVACIAYSVVSIKSLVRNGIDVNGETLYISHNQGPYIWEDSSKLKLRKQSREALAMIRKYFPDA